MRLKTAWCLYRWLSMRTRDNVTIGQLANVIIEYSSSLFSRHCEEALRRSNPGMISDGSLRYDELFIDPGLVRFQSKARNDALFLPTAHHQN